MAADPQDSIAPVPNIPLIDRPGTAPGPPPLARPPLVERKRVLVVDDERPVRDLIVRILSTENYDLRHADSAESALRLLAEPGAQPVDLLVTDLLMPGVNGRELAATVRAKYPAVRVLYQTGFGDSLFKGVVELAEGESFLEKPFGAESLLQAARLVMFGHITNDPPPPDARDEKPHWADVVRAKVFRFLKGPEPKRGKPRRQDPA